jgi:hypothetical protein
MKVMAFKGFDNVETFTVEKQGDPGFTLSSAGFNRAEVIVCDESVEGTISGNDVAVVLGDIGLPAGEYEGKLVVYSDVYPDGLVIAGFGLPESLRVTIKE